MDFDDFSAEKDNTQKILNKREGLKNQLASKLQKLGFSDIQIDGILNIIDTAEAKIEKIKISLNGTNINTDDPTPVMKQALDEIKICRLQMEIDIRTKISEILANKSKQ